tara:strand:+ start:31851 stop:32642 length:792 start_codon:yes stop_codon:yes gene_type:complete
MAYMTDENGNYKRTVRCGYCYEKGHNKSSCPELRKHLRDTIASATAAVKRNVWESPWVERSTKRRLEEATKQLHKLEGKGKTRKCGFCGDFGHTRRTCQKRKDKTAEMLKQTLNIRERVRDVLQDIGCAPGALVNVSVRDDRFPDGVLGVITSVSLKEVYHANVYDGSQWAPSYKHNVRVKLLQTCKDWYGTEYDEVSALMPIEAFNIDNHELHERYIAAMKDKDNLTTVVSPIGCDESAFDSNDFDDKLVSKWVVENIVDPR